MNKMRLVRAPLVVTVSLLAVVILVYLVPGALLSLIVLFALSTLPTAIAVLAATGTVVIFWRRHWASGMTMLFGFLMLLGAAGAPSPSQSLCRNTADLIHVMWYRGALESQVQSLQRRGISPAVALIAIDGFGSMADGIAYDPSGEIMRPPGQRSREWLATAGQTELGVDGLQARRIVGSYYSWFHY